MVAGEGPAGPIGTVEPRRQADDQEPMAPAAKGSHRQAVIIRVGGFHRVAESGEARAEPAVRLERLPAPTARLLQRALNCASSVDPRIAVIEELPPDTVCVTSSK